MTQPYGWINGQGVSREVWTRIEPALNANEELRNVDERALCRQVASRRPYWGARLLMPLQGMLFER